MVCVLPYVKFLELDLYTWMIIIGIVVAMALFSILTGKMGMSNKLFIFSLLVAIVAIVVGYLSAVLFQMVYDYIATGVWEWGSGATFYGGLIGAVVLFMAVYFVVGHFVFKDKSHIRQFMTMLCCIVPCIVTAHAFGRIGCLFAGCCHGAPTDSWIGITMLDEHLGWGKYVPVQLFESIFLFLLASALIYLLLKRKNEYIASIYLIAYGIWRFVIEYFRGDDRGSIGVEGLSPSQLISIIMVVVGVAIIFLYKFWLRRLLINAGKTVESTES